MAPEQLEGKEVDARTDIFAFGVVVYEMATGKKCFEGKSQASVISAIMSSDPPPMSSLQPMTPPALDRVVKKCFAKEQDKRWQAASDVCDELKWVAEGGSQTSQPVATLAGRHKVRERLGWIVAAMAIAALLAVLTSAILNQHRPASDAQPIRFTIDPPEKGFFALGLASPWPAVSPDGRQIVYEGTSADGQSSLWVRSLSSLSAQVLLGTSGSYVVSLPFWSPDSRYVGFFSSDGKLKKVAVSGGPSETLCDALSAGGGTWNHDGTIVFSQSTGLFRVSAAGGEAQALTTVESRGE
jgi:serine/threonine protein kinase